MRQHLPIHRMRDCRILLLKRTLWHRCSNFDRVLRRYRSLTGHRAHMNNTGETPPSKCCTSASLHPGMVPPVQVFEYVLEPEPHIPLHHNESLQVFASACIPIAYFRTYQIPYKCTTADKTHPFSYNRYTACKGQSTAD